MLASHAPNLRKGERTMSLSDYIIGIKNASGDMPPNQGHTCKNCKHCQLAAIDSYIYCNKYLQQTDPGAACASWQMRDGAQNETTRPNSSRK